MQKIAFVMKPVWHKVPLFFVFGVIIYFLLMFCP